MALRRYFRIRAEGSTSGGVICGGFSRCRSTTRPSRRTGTRVRVFAGGKFHLCRRSWGRWLTRVSSTGIGGARLAEAAENRYDEGYISLAHLSRYCHMVRRPARYFRINRRSDPQVSQGKRCSSLGVEGGRGRQRPVLAGIELVLLVRPAQIIGHRAGCDQKRGYKKYLSLWICARAFVAQMNCWRQM